MNLYVSHRLASQDKVSQKEGAMKTKCMVGIVVAVILIGTGESMGQWVPSFESYCGGMCSLGKNSLTVFAGAIGGEIFSSTDGGSTWQLITSGEIKNAVTAIAADDSMEFAGTNGGGIFSRKATGGGWTSLHNGFSDTVTNALLVGVGGNVIAGTEHGVFSSTDYGAAWTSHTSMFGNASVLSLLQDDSGTYAGTADGSIYFSSDHGSNWARRSLIENHKVTSLDTLGAQLYAATADSGIFVSTDGGFNWAPADSGLSNPSIAGLTSLGTTMIAVTSIGSGGAFTSADSGKTWAPVMGLHDSVFTAVLADAHNIYVSSNFNPGVFCSTDGGTSWSQVNLGGVTNSRINSFARLGSTIFAATSEGVVRSTDLGKTWSFTRFWWGYVNSVGANDSIALACCYPGIYRSSDKGITWSIVDSNFAYGSGYHIQYHDSTFYVARGFNVQYSRDGGLTWHVWTMPQGVEESVNDVAVIDSNIFAATGTLGVFQRTNNGGSWTSCESPANDVCLTAMDTVLFIGTSAGAYRSTDAGVNWTSAGLSSDFVYTLVPYGSYLFAGTDHGIFVSSDNGSTWTFKGQGLNEYVEAIVIIDSTVYVGNDVDGVWSRSVRDLVTGIESGGGSPPAQFGLLQNYPNPFNPTTIISYQLSVNSFVTLRVYDVLGRQVKTLINERQTAGSHSATFNAAGLSSGVYFYRLVAESAEGGQAGMHRDTKKLLLLK